MYRAGAAYAVGIFAVWQVVDIVGPALGWPDTVLTAVVVSCVALAPVVLSLAWVYDLRRERAQDHPAESSRDEIQEGVQERGTPSFLVLGPAALLTLLLAWVLWPQPGRGLAAFEAGDRALLSECENATGDPNLNGVLNTALAANLRQSMYVSLFSLDEARYFAGAFLQKTPPIQIDAETAREIGVRLGFKVVVHCSIHRVGNGYVLSSSIQEPGKQVDLAILTEQAETPEEIMDAVDALGNHLRDALGESVEALAETRPLRMVSTPSLEALISFTQGEEAWQSGDRARARDLWEQALERDSLFAAAHAGLGNYYYWQNQTPLGSEHYRQALAHPDRVAERDRFWIEANWASSRGDQERATGLYQAYLERWPQDASIWYNLGNQYMRAGNCEEAGRAFSAALVRNPSYAAAHINLGVCLARARQPDSAIHHYELGFALRPGMTEGPDLNHDFGSLLTEVGRGDEAEELFWGQLGRSPEQRARGYRSLGLLRVRQGRYREARSFLEEAARGQGALGQTLSEYRDRGFLAEVLEAMGEEAAARDQIRRMLALKDQTYLSPGWLWRVFRRLSTDGRLTEARDILDQARGDTLASGALERAILPAMEADLLARGGDLPAAEEEIRIAWASSTQDLVRLALCPVAVRTRGWTLALEVCEPFSAGVRLWEGTETGILAHFWIARIHEELGNREEARKWYERFLAFWGNADEGLRFRDVDGTLHDPIGEARSRLESLSADLER